MNIINNYYESSFTANEILKADKKLDELSGIYEMSTSQALINCSQKSKKRSRSDYNAENVSNFFVAVIKEFDHAQIVPILKIYLSKRFNLLISKVIELAPDVNLDKILQNVIIFRDILNEIDRQIYKENFGKVYKYLSENLFHHLLVSKEMILNFNRIAPRIINHNGVSDCY